MKAVHQNRILTVKQENVGTGKDFGIVGFQREKNASYFIFPKPLNKFKDRRVIGIKYDLAQTSAPLGKIVKQRSQPKRTGARGVLPAEWAHTAERAAVTSKPARVPQPKVFRVTIRFSSTVETTAEIEADSSREAREKALGKAATPDFTKGTITRKVLTVAPKRV
jgi:hypothetical protein